MEYNKCKTCFAANGKAGLLINDECKNCYDTRKENKIIIHTYLIRTEAELIRTFKILENAQ